MKACKRSITGAVICVAILASSPYASPQSQEGTSVAAAAVAEFGSAYKTRKDDKILAAISKLIDAYLADATTDAEKGQIISSLGKALKFAGKDGRVTVLAAQGLAGMGVTAAKPLVSSLKDKKFRKQETLKDAYLAMIRALGATKSVKDYKLLADLLKDKDNLVISAAADGLGNYSDVKLSYRKKIAEAMIKILDGTYNAAKADPRNNTLQKKYEEIYLSLFNSLQKVTGATVGSVPEWRKWYNSNKGKRWE